MALRICFVSSEVAPLAKTGGLADVSGALAKYLSSAGHDVRLFMPMYAQVDLRGLEYYPVSFLQNIPLRIGPHELHYSVTTVRLPGTQLFVYLIDCPALYHRPSLYSEAPDEHLRFLLLTRAAFECCQRMAFAPQILHCNDWHTAFAPLFRRTLYSWDRLFHDTRTVLTIHNLGYQGFFPASAVADLGLPESDLYLLHQDDLRAGYVNSLKHGILYADAITTVSPTYAREICTDEHGMGLQHVLRARSDALVGILNGVDYDVWDPRYDRYLPRHYGPEELEIKADIKRELLERLNLRAGPRTPLAGIVTRLIAQKGLDLLIEALPRVLNQRDLVFVALGSGEERYERFFTQLEKDFPHRVTFRRGYNDELAHWIEAASDMFLMPSQYEPCGLNQMYSLRYGTVPIVRRTGGLADSVTPFDPSSGRGTGFLFDAFTPEALELTINTALDLYAEPAQWRRLVLNGMSEDFSWNRQGAQYIALYQRLLGNVM